MSKLPLHIVNRTNYFNPNLSKVSLELKSPETFSFKSNKQQGYEVRLYYEYLDTVKKGGQVFFYTLTYNNKSLPKYEGINCFDYNDLVYLLNGGFKKILNRRYHTRLKYFVGAELGEGAGKRGFENNPHYHILFFLTPLDDSYIQITPIQFRHYVRLYWQGFDQDIKFHSFKYAKYGIAKEGDNFGKVLDYRACMYCAKYVTKDVALQKFEYILRHRLRKRYFGLLFNSPLVHNNFYVSVVLPKFSVPSIEYPDCPTKADWYFSEHKTLQYIVPRLYDLSKGTVAYHVHNFFTAFLNETQLHSDYYDFVNNLVDDQIRFDINIFRNRYSNKCRISQGVGLLALEDVNIDSPYVLVPDSKDGFKAAPLCLYYLRKLFYNVEKDNNGNNIYVLNKAGIDFKCSLLPGNIKRLSERVVCIKDFLDSKIYDSVNSYFPLSCSFEYIRDCLNESFTENYAVYKFVYEGRFFKEGTNNFLSPLDDYRRFLEPSYYCSDYNPTGVKDFCNDLGLYKSYSEHFRFKLDISLFNDFDSILLYLSINSDDKIESEFLETRRIKKYFSQQKFKSYISNF